MKDKINIEYVRKQSSSCISRKLKKSAMQREVLCDQYLENRATVYLRVGEVYE